MALQDLRPGAALESLRRDIAVPRGKATPWSRDTSCFRVASMMKSSSVQMILGLIWIDFSRDVKRKKN